MSLLLAALKKTEQNRPGVPQATALNLSDEARIAGQKLFAAKTAHVRGTLGVIPLAILVGLVLAAGGGYYVWREISPPPQRARPAVVQPTPPQPTMLPVQSVAVQSLAVPSLAGAEQTQSDNLAERTTAVDVSPSSERVAKNIREPVKSRASRTPARHAASNTGNALQVERNNGADGVDPTLLSAWQAYRAGDFATAWQLYGTVLQRDNKNRDALLGMAAIARQQGQDNVAAKYYSRVLSLDPRDPQAHAGMAALASSDSANTESKLKLQLSFRPDAAELHFALGNLYAEQLRWSEAQPVYQNAYNRNPDDAQFAFNLAVSLDHLGQNKQAAQLYQKALQLNASAATGINREQVQQRINDLTANLK